MLLDGFKLKSFDLQPIYASWPDAPKFVGNPKKDLSVDKWLKQIKVGCEERKVPKEYWHKVAQHYMGEKAKKRLNELKSVMAKVNGGDYHWNWDKFKIAMRNMAWNVDVNEMREIKVNTGRSWWFPQKPPVEESLPSKPSIPTKPSGITRQKSTPTGNGRPAPNRSGTLDMFWPVKKDDGDNQADRPAPQKSKSGLAATVMPMPSRSKTLAPPGPMATPANQLEVVTATAPAWLISACTALDLVDGERPKVMSILGAILITAGSIPAIPAISAGAGGAFLASGAAQTAGAIAVGVGSWLRGQESTPASDCHSHKASEKSA